MNAVAVKLDRINKSYKEGSSRLNVLHNVTTEFSAGKFTALLGKSGSGKSTLLNLISGIDTPSGGDVWVGDTPITRLSEHERTVFRRDRMGIVFQFFNLIPTLTVLENVTLPYDLAGYGRREGRNRGVALLKRIGLDGRHDVLPDRLSGGEQQRVAVARALVHDPDLVLADEPTGNLDAETGKGILDLLLGLTCDAGKTIIMATHSAGIISLADEVYAIQGGKLVAVTDKGGPIAKGGR